MKKNPSPSEEVTMTDLVRAPSYGMVLRPQTYGELIQFAQSAAKSALVPKDYAGKPENVLIAVQMGSEIGLAPMQAIQSIAVINGRPALWGDAMPGLCRASGLVDYMKEWSEGEGDALTWFCEAKRKDDPNPIRRSFSIADAKAAGLIGKPGPWTQYRGRMLMLRARGFALRDAFADVLKGLVSAEEAADIPDGARDFTGTTIDSVAAEGPAQGTHEAVNAAVPYAEDKPPEDKAAVVAAVLAQRFTDAKDREEYDLITMEEQVGRQRLWLESKRPELSEAVEAAASAALARVGGDAAGDVL